MDIVECNDKEHKNLWEPVVILGIEEENVFVILCHISSSFRILIHFIIMLLILKMDQDTQPAPIVS